MNERLIFRPGNYEIENIYILVDFPTGSLTGKREV